MRLKRGLPILRSLQELKQPESLSNLKGANSPAYIAKYSPHLALPNSATPKFQAIDHPLCLPLINHYETRPDPFWWFLVLSNKVAGDNAVVRRWILRRVRVAFTTALKDFGYNKDGTKIPGMKNSKPELKGTVNLIVQQGIHTTGHEQLLSNFKRVVLCILEACKSAQMEENQPQMKGTRPQMKGTQQAARDKAAVLAPEHKDARRQHFIREAKMSPEQREKEKRRPQGSSKQVQKDRGDYKPASKPAGNEQPGTLKVRRIEAKMSPEKREKEERTKQGTSKPVQKNSVDYKSNSKSAGNEQPGTLKVRRI